MQERLLSATHSLIDDLTEASFVLVADQKSLGCGESWSIREGSETRLMCPTFSSCSAGQPCFPSMQLFTSAGLWPSDIRRSSASLTFSPCADPA